MTEEYKRSCEDEIAWANIDQLHAATLQISQSCFEYKKLCVGFLAAAMTVIIKFTENSIDHSLFLIPISIVFGFWLADSTAYFFQRATRKKMETEMSKIESRNQIENENKPYTSVSKFEALFNGSMTLYYVLFLISLIWWISFECGWIGG